MSLRCSKCVGTMRSAWTCPRLSLFPRALDIPEQRVRLKGELELDDLLAFLLDREVLGIGHELGVLLPLVRDLLLHGLVLVERLAVLHARGDRGEQNLAEARVFLLATPIHHDAVADHHDLLRVLAGPGRETDR